METPIEIDDVKSDVHPNIYIWLAKYALSKNKPLEAENLLRNKSYLGSREIARLRLLASAFEAQENWPDAIALNKQLRDPVALRRIGSAAAATAKLDEARQAFEAAYVIDAERTANSLARFAWQQQGEVEYAERVLRIALRDYPNSFHVTNWQLSLSELLIKLERYEEAETYLSQIIVSSPDVQTAYLLLGRLYFQRDQSDKSLAIALSSIEQAIALAPSDPANYAVYARILVQSKEFLLADAWFAQAIERSANAQPYILSRSSNLLYNLNDTEAAASLLQDGADRYPESAPIWYELSLALLREGHDMEAITAIENALHHAPAPQADYYLRAGLIYESAGQIQEAVNALTRALQLDPELSTAQSTLSRILASTPER